MTLDMPKLIVILVIFLVLFGGVKKLPEMARSLGQAVKEFKKSMAEEPPKQHEEAPKKQARKKK